ncbi:unnamed protein product, partial [Ectocarpus sp. 6 AP-2014]
LRGPALGGQGVNGMCVEGGDWDGEEGLLPCIDWPVGFENLPDGSNGDGDEGKDGGGKGRTVDVVGAAAPTPATNRPKRPVSSLSSLVLSIGANESYHKVYKRGGSTSPFGSQNVMETERLIPHVQPDTVTAVRQMISTGHDPSIHVPKLVEFVQNEDDSALQIESVGLLATISGSHTNVVVESGAVPIFVRLLTSANDDIREEVVRAVGNIAGDSPLFRDMVLQGGALGPLLQQLTDGSKPSMLRIATWALKKFCGEISSPRLEQISPALPTLARLIRSVDEEVRYRQPLTEECFCLYPQIEGACEMVLAVVGAGVCQPLVELLDHASPSVHLGVLWAMNGIVSSEDQHTQVLIDSNVLPRLHHLLVSSHHQKLREKTCQVIWMITTGREEQIQSVMETGIIPVFIQLLADADSDIRGHAATAILNVTKIGEPEKVKEWIPPLLNLLENDDDTHVILTVLEILEKIFRKVRLMIGVHRVTTIVGMSMHVVVCAQNSCIELTVEDRGRFVCFVLIGM